MSKCCNCGDFLLCILAIILSPIAVLIKRGCTCTFLVNLLLFILGILPGIVHAWYVILKWDKFKRVLLTVLSFILPPLAVLIHRGCHCFDVLLNILLTILGFVPGVIHAIIVVWKN